MEEREKIFDDVADKMNLYFIFGTSDNFKSFDDAFKNANFKLKDKIPDYFEYATKKLESELGRECFFNEVAYSIWRKKRNDYEREKRNCLRILNDLYE